VRPAELDPQNRPKPPTVDREIWREGALSVREAAAFLGCSRKHVYQLMNEGRLPWGRLGRARRIPKAALLDILTGDLA